MAIAGIYQDGDSGEIVSDVAGKVFINGQFAGIVAGGTASFAQTDIPADVYVSFPITASTASTAVEGYTIGTRVYGVTRKPDTENTIWYNVRLARLTGEPATPTWHIEQTHFGDIYIDLPTSTTIVGSTYTGPFHVYVEGGSAFVDCPDCIHPEGSTIQGKYITNGGSVVHNVSGLTPVPITGASTDIYLQIGSTTPSLSKQASTALNVYNVLLAQVSGSSVCQMQYGYIHVDGRWQ